MLLTMAGCSAEHKLPPPADAEQARAGLAAALEAWKQDESPDLLQQRDPPIYFNDMAWRAGQQLKRYEVSPAIERVGQSLAFSATLILQDQNGRQVRRQALYIIDTGAAIVIVANEPTG
jgi:hypothetical protein